MKKILTLVVLSSTAFALHADYKNGDSRGQYPGQQYQGQSPQQPIQGRGYSSTYETAPSTSTQSSTTTQSRTYSSTPYQGGAAPQQYGGNSDQALLSKVQSTLSGSKYSNITANVKNGVVTLQGDVSTVEDKVSLGALIGGIDGVQSVNNQVTVQGQMLQGSTYQQQGYSQSQQSQPGYTEHSGSTYQSSGSQNYNAPQRYQSEHPGSAPQQGYRNPSSSAYPSSQKY